MTELELLLKQKRDIERKIRDIKAISVITVGNLRFEKKDPGKFSHPWQLSSLTRQIHREYENRWDGKVRVEREVDRWQMFVREKTRTEAIAKLKSISEDLKKMIEQIEQLNEFDDAGIEDFDLDEEA